MAKAKDIIKLIQKKFKKEIISAEEFRGEAVVKVKKEKLLDVCAFLFKDKKLLFNLLIDVTAVDFLPYKRTPRFDIVYILTSIDNEHRMILKTEVDEGEKVPSVYNIWRSANFPERETFDMFGIEFEGHPDLRRLLMWPGYEHYPLRKDFPTKGYDFEKKWDPETIKENVTKF
jgi:NADH-quinone oxidoreductase subunit C